MQRCKCYGIVITGAGFGARNLFSTPVRPKQILRFARDDNFTISDTALCRTWEG